MVYKPALHAYSANLEKFFYAYSAIVDVYIYFFLRNITFRSMIVN